MSKKYWGKKTNTTDKKEQWQEPFTRETSVPATAIQALDTLLGFSGSWFGSLSDRYSSYTTEYVGTSGKMRTSEPSNPKWRVSNLGVDGFPEINFVPYNYRTNAVGSKGGALLGHPISLSVIGPTMKSIDQQYWQWSVVNALTIQLNSTHPTHTLTLEEIYGPIENYLNNDATNGGLYLVISESGADRRDPSANKTYEYFFNDVNDNGIYPKEEYGQSAHYEIFRIANIDNSTGTITLAPNKPLDKYFVIPANNPVIKSVMVFNPYVTRLIAVPEEDGITGAETKFLVVSPEHAAHSDLHEIFDNSIAGTMGQTVDSNARRGFIEGQKLPIPIPLKNLSGKLESNLFGNNTSKLDRAGVFRLYDLPAGHGLNGGEIIHITDVSAVLRPVGTTPNQVPTPTVEDIGFDTNSLLGWFEVIEASASMIQLRRQREVNIHTGETDFGFDLYLDQAGKNLHPTSEIVVEFTTHEPVEEIFKGEYNISKVEACRLTNLIDPNWVDRTTKQISDDAAGTLYAGSPAKADRSIFTTNSVVGAGQYSDAGSLLDLGFRMVLFPATENQSGNAVPDFSRPITSLEAIIDATKSDEKQTISIDYSSGCVTLSHRPQRSGVIKPHGIVGTSGNNPRGEVVLFAACVPYSMERGQTGTGISVMGGSLASADHGHQNILYASPLGEKITVKVRAYDRKSQTVGDLYVRSSGRLPPKGKFQRVLEDFKSDDLPSLDSSHSTRAFPETGIYGHTQNQEIIGYRSLVFNGVGYAENGKHYDYMLRGVYHNTLSNSIVDDFKLILRKQSIRFVDLTDDTTYGSAFRSDTLRFAFADLSVNVDGSITVLPTAVAGPSQELRGLFPLQHSNNPTVNLEGGRVAFDTRRGRWIVSSPPHKAEDVYQIGLEIARGKAYVSDVNEFDGYAIDPISYRVAAINKDSEPANSNRYDFALEHTPADGKYLASLIDGYNYDLKFLVKAETVVSKALEWANEPFDDNYLVLAFRHYDGTDQRMEAPNNPINWVAVKLPTGIANASSVMSAIDTQTDQLGVAMGLSQSERINGGKVVSVLEHTASPLVQRIGLTERSVEVMPSLYYLKSDPINASTPFNATAADTMTITIRSADPRFPNNWCTFVLPTDDAFSSSDPIEVAAYLNIPLYDRNCMLKYVGNQLEKAGFVKSNKGFNPHLMTGNAVGSVPALDALDTGFERQILFAAHDDPRHPAFDQNTGTGDPSHPDYERVILTCSGCGSAHRDINPTYVNGRSEYVRNHISQTLPEDHFNNVLVEVAHWVDGDSSLAQRLGGSFRTAYPQTSVVRCGLFYKSNNAPYNNSYQHLTINTVGDLDTKRMTAKLGDYFDLHGEGYGTISSAFFLGSLRIVKAQLNTPYQFIIEVEDERLKSLKNQERKNIITGTGLERTTPNLSLWTEHIKRLEPINLVNPSTAGNYAVWGTLTTETIEGYEFKDNFTATRKLKPPTQLFKTQNPSLTDKFIRDNIHVTGDYILIETTMTDKGGDVTNIKLRGISLSDDNIIALQDTDWYYDPENANPESTGYDGVMDHVFNPFLGWDVSQNTFSGPSIGYGNSSGINWSFSFIPSSSVLQNSRSTMKVTNPYSDDGIKNEFGSVFRGNSTYVMGGHIDLFSSTGDNHNAGFTLGTSVKISPYSGNSGYSTFLSFIEHGVFRNLYGKSLTSDPFYSNKMSGFRPDGLNNTSRGIFESGDLTIAGVSGVRFSGDTNLWVKNLQLLNSSGKPTAAIIPTYRQRATNKMEYESLIGRPMSELEHRIWRDLDNNDLYGNHKPHTYSGGLGELGFAKQEGIVLLGLTRKDFAGWRRFTGLDSPYATNQADSTFFPDVKGNFGTFLDGGTLPPNTSISKNLEGKYIKFSAVGALPAAQPQIAQFAATTSGSEALKITSAPVLVAPSYFRGDEDTAKLIEKNAGGLFSVGKGGFPKDFVAIVAIKVEWVAAKKDELHISRLQFVNPSTYVGYTWGIFEDATCETPIAIGEVVESGGYPTGLTNTLTGLSIDPTQFGKPSLKVRMVNENHPTSNPSEASLHESRLYGVSPILDRNGTQKSIAYFSVPKGGYDFLTRTDTFRMIINSEETALLEDFTYGDWENRNFSVDEEGFVQFRQKKRLGLGVVIDGGLGVVHAKGFRANPRPIRKINYGSLQIFGSSSYPYADYNSKKAAIHLASVLDTTEFIDDAFIVSPKGALIFEDARATQGLSSRLKENAMVIHSNSLLGGNGVSYSIFTNDALFPYNMGGILFRGTGSVKYERGYNALSSKPVNPLLSGFLGKGETSGIKGSGVANHGTCFLLPKGPTSVTKHYKTNWGDGQSTINTPSSQPNSPLDVPLYEWTNGVAKHRFAFSVTGCFYDFGMVTGKNQELNVTGASSPHKVSPGLLHQGSRKNWSRYVAPYNVPEMFRVSEGMIVENISNGTFHTVGEIGRRWIESAYRTTAWQDSVGDTSTLGADNRPMNQGSRVLSVDYNNPEENSLFYDLNPLFGFKNSWNDPCLGGGDRTDTFIDLDVNANSTLVNVVTAGAARTHVRNSVAGHRLRLVPNVECVPLLGEHNCDGGLIPARAKTTESGNVATIPQLNGAVIENADAIFYSMSHNFKPANAKNGAGDIGKFLYICGTDVYQYTGWWVIIDVIEDYKVNEASMVNSQIENLFCDVAVLRKWKRDGVRAGELPSGRGALPLTPRAPYLRMSSSNLFSQSNGLATEEWFDINTCGDISLQFNQSNTGSLGTLVVPAAYINARSSMYDLVQDLNNDPDYNGANWMVAQGYPSMPFLKWIFEGNKEAGHGGKYGTIAVTYDVEK